jgi:hypothetical protein
MITTEYGVIKHGRAQEDTFKAVERVSLTLPVNFEIES